MNKKLYYIKMMNFCNGLVFYAPIALLLRTTRGITLKEFIILQVILQLVICISEIPCGIITDKIGYKKTIVLSCLLLLLARIQFLYANTFIIFMIEAILEGISISFSSGTINAYIYNIIEDKYNKELAIIDNYGTIGFILSTIMFYIIYKLSDIMMLIILTVITTFISFIFSLFIEPENTYKENNKKINTELIKQKNFWKITLYSSLTSLGIITINFFYIIKLTSININEENISIIILLYSLIQTITPKIIDKLNKETKKQIKLFTLLGGISFLIIYFIKNKITIIIMMIILPTIIMLPQYILYTIQNKYIDHLDLTTHRATILSMFNMGNNMISIILFIIVSININISGLNIFLITGILYITLSLIYTDITIKND